MKRRRVRRSSRVGLRRLTLIVLGTTWMRSPPIGPFCSRLRLSRNTNSSVSKSEARISRWSMLLLPSTRERSLRTLAVSDLGWAKTTRRNCSGSSDSSSIFLKTPADSPESPIDSGVSALRGTLYRSRDAQAMPPKRRTTQAGRSAS